MAIGFYNSRLGGFTFSDEVIICLTILSLVHLAEDLNSPYGARDADDIYHSTNVSISYFCN